MDGPSARRLRVLSSKGSANSRSEKAWLRFFLFLSAFRVTGATNYTSRRYQSGCGQQLVVCGILESLPSKIASLLRYSSQI